MRTKITLVLLLLNVALAFYIFHYERQWAGIRQQLENRRRVLGPEASTIDSFSRTGNNTAPVRVEKRGDTWWLTQPYEWPANLNAISRILTELRFLENISKFRTDELKSKGLSLADYGLDKPTLTFMFTSAGKDYELRLGDDTKTGNRLYLLSPDGANVHVVGRSLADSLGLPISELRSPAIFTIPAFEVRSLGVQSGSLKTRLRRDGSRWIFETPIIARASKARVETTVTTLNSLRALRFLEARDPNAEKAGLDNPTLRVTLEGNARRETLLIGTPVPQAAGAPEGPTQYFARIEDKAVTFTTIIPQDLIDDLKGAQEKLRDAHVIEFDPVAVNSVTLNAPGQTPVTLQRLEGTGSWQTVTRSIDGRPPETQAADPELVGALLDGLHGLEAEKFVSDAPSAADLESYGFNRPEREIALGITPGSGSGEGTTLTVLIGTSPERRGTAFAKLSTAPYVYQVSPEILARTPVAPLQYRQRLLRDLPAGARITGMRLLEAGSESPVLSRQLTESETWESALAAEKPERRKAIETLREELRHLRARRFISASFDPDHATFEGVGYPWRYKLEVTLSLVGGNGSAQTSTSTLSLTERIGGGSQLAGTDDFGGVTFEISQPLLDALFALLYGEKADPGPPPATENAPSVPPATAPAGAQPKDGTAGGAAQPGG